MKRIKISNGNNNNNINNNFSVQETSMSTTTTTTSTATMMVEEEGANVKSLEDAVDRLENMINDGFSGSNNNNNNNNNVGSMFGANEYVQIYTHCYDFCAAAGEKSEDLENLYNLHRKRVETYLTRHVLPALQTKLVQGSSSSTMFLAEVFDRWEKHQIMNKWHAKFFMCLDRYYALPRHLPTIEQAGVNYFESHLYDCIIKGHASSAIIDLIQKERNGEIVDKYLIKSIVKLFESMKNNNGKTPLKAYTEDFEQQFLQVTREYYSSKREEWVGSLSVPDYLINAENAFDNERTRVREYLNSSTEDKIMDILDDEILKKVQTNLMVKESERCRSLLENDQFVDLKRMFRLFHRLENGLTPIAPIFQDFITTKGIEHISRREMRIKDKGKEKNEDHEFIKELIALNTKYLDVVKDVYGGYWMFGEALTRAFVDIINNHNVGKFTNAELMCSFCDQVLKTGGEKMNDDSEIETHLDHIVQLFKYLSDKDLFGEIYRNFMAKRFLSQASKGMDVEKLMISKLKMECGKQFTSKLEGVLNDLVLSESENKDFEERMRQVESNLNFSVQVLTTGYWPTYKMPDVTVTDEMQKCMNVFEHWHATRHQKRKLKWVMSHGNASVQGIYGSSKRYDFQVTTLQAIALNALNGGITLTFEELAERLNLEETILKPLMHSLSCGKYKVLQKEPMNNKINSKDKFRANSKFKANLRKIRIPMASLDASYDSKKIEENRTIVIEAAIVRIMKSRKTLRHQDLLSNVLSQLATFSPSVKVVKKRIESLIDREYLERDTQNPGFYNYLA